MQKMSTSHLPNWDNGRKVLAACEKRKRIIELKRLYLHESKSAIFYNLSSIMWLILLDFDENNSFIFL